MLPPSAGPNADAAPSKRRWPIVLLLALALLGLDAFVIEPNWIEVTFHDVGVPGGEAITVLQLTDLHIRTRGYREGKVLELLDALQPDLVVITGDSVLPGSERAEVTAFLRALRERAPRLGIWACQGNHEDWLPGSLAWYREAGVPVLAHESVTLLNGALTITGSPAARGPALPSGPGFNLVLCHYPAVLQRAAEAKADLVLVGHSHGGQVALPFVKPWLPFDSADMSGAWYERDQTLMYVSRGVGTSVLPVRFLCRPEVAVFRIGLPPRSPATPAPRSGPR